MDAGFLDRAEIEGLGVDELDDEDAEQIVISEVLRRENLGGSSREVRVERWLAIGGVVGREELEDLIA